jgi:hypothetical protein
MIDESFKERVIRDIFPEITRLAENTLEYGEISLRAKISDYKVGTISIGIETARKTPKDEEEE